MRSGVTRPPCHGTHPTDLGFIIMADALAPAIKRILDESKKSQMNMTNIPTSMMTTLTRLTALAGLVVTLTVGIQSGIAGETIDWAAARLHNARMEQEASVLTVSKGADKKVTEWSMTAPWKPSDTSAEGLSFEIRGDGSKYFASVFLSYDPVALMGYEAVFPLESQEWTTVTLRFDDFVESSKPWSVRGKMTPESNVIDPSRIRFIACGQGYHFYKFYPAECAFSIRNIQLVTKIDRPSIESYSKGLGRTTKRLKEKQDINVLLLGDSITDLGGDNSYAVHACKKLTEQYGSAIRVANCGIAGHSVRGGTIVLPRSLQTMPKPDLVCILYGANDCKAVGGSSGFDQAAFKVQLERLIDAVRRHTKGQADILLINGVPRLDKARNQSTGEVEKIAGAVEEAARSRETAFLDTMDVYLKLDSETRKRYYRDTVHQNAEGLAFLGDLLFWHIQHTLNR